MYILYVYNANEVNYEQYLYKKIYCIIIYGKYL